LTAFRYGFFGVSDVSPWLSLGMVGRRPGVRQRLAVHLLRTGYKIRTETMTADELNPSSPPA
jgi:ABC-2 type transport system permease protein